MQLTLLRLKKNVMRRRSQFTASLSYLSSLSNPPRWTIHRRLLRESPVLEAPAPEATVRKLNDALVRHFNYPELHLMDVSMYKYAPGVEHAPMELIMVDNNIGRVKTIGGSLKLALLFETPQDSKSSDSESDWDLFESQIKSNPIHCASSVALALTELNYGGGFYDAQAARCRVKKDIDGTRTLPLANWPNLPQLPPEEGEHSHVAQLVIRQWQGYQLRTPIFLTLPSPHVLRRFRLLKKHIFRDFHARSLLSAVWKWTRFHQLYQFTPTAVAIMTGDFLQRTPTPTTLMSYGDVFASFLRYASHFDKLHTDNIISIYEPKGDIPPSRPQRTWPYSPDPDKRIPVNPQASPEQPQPMNWRSQPLIIQDPYVLTQNHAEGVSMKQLNRFISDCQAVVEALDVCNFLASIFEPTPQENSMENILRKGVFDILGLPVPEGPGLDDPYILEKAFSQPDKNPGSELTSNNLGSPVNSLDTSSADGLGDLEAAFVDRIMSRRSARLPVRQSDGEESIILPWHHHQYEENEAAFVDEVFDAESASISSYTLVPLSFTKSLVPAEKAMEKATFNFSPEQVASKTANVDPQVEQADIAFLTELMEKSNAAEGKQRQTLNKVRKVFQEKYGASYGVEAFGSSRYGVTTPTSDLDLVILDPSMKYGHKPKSSPLSTKLYSTSRLSRWLNNGGFKILKSIPEAAVPIIKFLHRKTGVHCDICVNERLGLLNSKLLEAYCRMSPLLRPMLLLIKTWAKPRGLNSPASESEGTPTFSSYALTLMTVNFLQIRGLLPNLQANLPPLNPLIPGSVYWTRSKGTIVECDVRYHSEVKDWKPESSPSLRDVMTDWFAFWGEEFDYTDKIISIKEGRVIDAGDLDITRRKSEVIYVRDPFIVEKNVARAIRQAALEFFIAECRSAAASLRDGATFRELAVVHHGMTQKQVRHIRRVKGFNMEDMLKGTVI